VLGLVAAVVFATSLDALPGTPRAFGTNWDAEAGIGDQALQRDKGPCSGLPTAIADDHAVAGISEVCTGTGEVNGRGVTVVGFAPLSGDVGPTVLDGRAPRARDEVALGTDTLDEIHRSIGDTVRIASPEGTHAYRVVGRVILPVLSGTTDNQAIAEGALVSGPAFARISSDDASTPAVVIRWRDGADVQAARRRLASLPEGVRLFPSRRVPLEVDRLEQVDALPWVLAALLAIIGCLGLAYALATTVRSRAHELATLKTLGFRRGQVVSTVAVQATVLAGLGVLVGVPLGVLLGRLVWQRVADRAGMAGETTVSVLAVVGIAAVTVVVANLVAGVPARRAARLRPAVVLRSE
jgi:predicted lysophospholipase L1 biosynthesis ABC-type transport system permease subunit